MSGGYVMYLDGTQMPITPGKLQLKIKGKNKTITLVNDGEVNFLRQPGLTEITVPLTLPMLQDYGGGAAASPEQFLGLFERIITGLKPVRFILSRMSPDGRRLYDTNLKVSLESYNIDENAKNGPDVAVSLTLKRYVDFGTKTVRIVQQPAAAPAAVVEPQRETDNAPQAKTYTVAKGDCLWNIAKKYYGSGADYQKIFAANKDKINNPNLIYPGQVLTIP
jgi:LysM repeat protein